MRTLSTLAMTMCVATMALAARQAPSDDDVVQSTENLMNIIRADLHQTEESPRPVGDLLLNAFKADADEATRMAAAFELISYENLRHLKLARQADEATVIVIGSAHINNDRVRIGHVVEEGDVIYQGFLINQSNEVAHFSDDVVLPPKCGLAVNFIDLTGEIPRLDETDSGKFNLVDLTATSIGCGPGYYACCYYDDQGRARSDCIRISDIGDADCKAGGPGAISCAVSGAPTEEKTPAAD